MRDRVQRLARQSAFYSLGNVAVKFGGLVLAPILLNPAYLDVASYGYLALLLVTAQLGVFAVGLGVSSGLLRFWTHDDYRDRQSALAATALIVSLLLAVSIPAAIYLSLAERAAELLLDDPAKKTIVGFVLLYVGFKIIGSVPLTVFRVQERPLAYGAIQLLEVALLVAISVYLLVVREMGLEGVVISYAAAAAGAALVSTTVVFGRLRWIVDPRAIRPLIAFGAPLALASLSAWVLNSSDRYLLKWLSDPTVIASYDWASRVAGVINVFLVQSFQLAFIVVGLQRLDAKDVTLHREMFRHYVVWTGWAILGLATLSGDAMQLMSLLFGVDQNYVDISSLVLLVGIGFWSYGANQIVTSVLTSAGKTGVIAFCIAIAAALNVGLNIVLIPELGGIGAAVATALAFLVMTGTSTIFAEKRMRVDYDWSLAGTALLLVLGLFWGSTLSSDWSAMPRIGLRVGLVVAYAPLLLATGSYRSSEFKGGVRTLLTIAQLRGPSASDDPG